MTDLIKTSNYVNLSILKFPDIVELHTCLFLFVIPNPQILKYLYYQNNIAKSLVNSLLHSSTSAQLYIPISQKRYKESITPPSPLNPTFLTPPPTAGGTRSQQAPKRKRRRIQYVNYLADHKVHGKQLRKRRHEKFKPYKYSMGKEDED